MSTSKRNALLDKIIAKNEVLPMTSRVQKIYYTTDPICSENAVKTSRSYLTKAINNGDVKIYDFKKDADVTSEDITYNEDMLITVKTIVANKLNISVDDVDTNAHIMLDLGADSMQYFSILSALAEEFSISNPEKGVLYYTVHEFCQYIERHI